MLFLKKSLGLRLIGQITTHYTIYHNLWVAVLLFGNLNNYRLLYLV
ncbi:hypothetical protein ACFL1S_08530 [Pseudomonadota bacterium]